MTELGRRMETTCSKLLFYIREYEAEKGHDVQGCIVYREYDGCFSEPSLFIYKLYQVFLKRGHIEEFDSNPPFL